MLRATRQGNESHLCWQDRAENDAYKTASEGKGTNWISMSFTAVIQVYFTLDALWFYKSSFVSTSLAS